jgi:hypothetical protein
MEIEKPLKQKTFTYLPCNQEVEGFDSFRAHHLFTWRLRMRSLELASD